MDPMTESELQWRAPEFEDRRKDISWYWASICAAIVILGFAVWNGNFLFGFFIVVAEILLLVWGNQAPEMLEFSLTAKSLRAGARTAYPLVNIESFSVAEVPNSEWEIIFFRFKHSLRLPAAILVPRDRLQEVTRLMGQTIPQIEHEESLLDTLERFFGF